MRNFIIGDHQSAVKLFLKMKTPKDVSNTLCISLKMLYELTLETPYKNWIMTNKRGKKRLISEPPGDLRLLQLRLNGYLQLFYFDILPEMVHGFVWCPKDSTVRRSIKTNALPHCGKAVVINADIRHFFSTIHPVSVRNVFLNPPFCFNHEIASLLALLCLNKTELPTGAPTSPIISNFVFLPIDEKLKSLADKHHYTYTRYVDDLTFSGDIRPDDTFKPELEDILRGHGFELNQRKYRVQSKYGRQTVTGLVVNEKPNMNRKYRKNVRAMVHDITTNGLSEATARHYHCSEIPEHEQRHFFNSVMGMKRWVEEIRGMKLG
jgi:RNA-directed DNA polymerase